MIDLSDRFLVYSKYLVVFMTDMKPRLTVHLQDCVHPEARV